MVVHDLTQKTVEIINPNITHDKLVEWVNNGDEIIGFIGWVEVSEDILDELVPDVFPNNRLVEYDDEGNVVSEKQLTFREYVGGLYHNSINAGKILLPVGKRDEHGNRGSVLGNDELMVWINYFGIENIIVKDDIQEFIKSNSNGDEV